MHHDFRRHSPAFARGLQEIHSLAELSEVDDGAAIHAVFIDLAASDVVNFHVPLACAEIEVEGAVGGIGIDYNIGFRLLNCTDTITDFRLRWSLATVAVNSHNEIFCFGSNSNRIIILIAPITKISGIRPIHRSNNHIVAIQISNVTKEEMYLSIQVTQ